MKKLFEGVKEFSKVHYIENVDFYKELGEVQKPHTLFIGCSDSRVVPDLITKSLPGELFVIRNIANIVPYYRASAEFLSTTSAIEYAITVLKVHNIVVCGHSNCGGCRALFMTEEETKNIPHTQKWLQLARNAKDKAEKILAEGSGADRKELSVLVEQINVIEQLNNLFTYPLVRELYEKDKLNIYGWYYEISTGHVYNFDFEHQEFKRIE